MPTSRFHEMIAKMKLVGSEAGSESPRRRLCDCGAVLGEDDLWQCPACERAAEAAERERRRAVVRAMRREMWYTAQVPKRLQGARLSSLDAATQKAVGLWLDDPGAALLTFTGAVGSGKTFAAVATLCESIMRLPEKEVFSLTEHGLPPALFRFVSWPDALADVREFRRDEDPAGDLAGFSGLLILDDLAAGAATDFGRETLYRIIDKRWRDGLRLVTTADVAPKALAERLGDRIASRLLSGTVLRIQGGDRRLTR
jgi:DNA replication protein DnaC